LIDFDLILFSVDLPNTAINAPANPNLNGDILVNLFTICYAEEAVYGLNQCISRSQEGDLSAF
jgi:hypothetical protein